jgi:hypothetical protein
MKGLTSTLTQLGLKHSGNVYVTLCMYFEDNSLLLSMVTATTQR